MEQEKGFQRLDLNVPGIDILHNYFSRVSTIAILNWGPIYTKISDFYQVFDINTSFLDDL